MVVCLEQGVDCLHMVQLMLLLSQNPINKTLLWLAFGICQDAVFNFNNVKFQIEKNLCNTIQIQSHKEQFNSSSAITN